MIKNLHIRNYAIIEKLNVQFSEGLTIITGETGAGKSILLGALGLIMGKRADTKSLYDTTQKCIVEATFNIKKYDLKAFFDKNDIDFYEELVIRRELTPSSRSRAFVNDTPVNLKLLQQLSGALIDLHQQFDTLDIHNVSFQLRMIDALAKNKNLLKKYEEGYRHYKKNKHQLRTLIDQNENSAREIDFINFQLEEFNEAELINGEQEQLEKELAQLTNAEEIKRVLSTAFQQLSESEQSIANQLNEIGLSISPIKKFHPKLDHLHEKLEGLTYELQDVAQEFERIAEDTEYDAQRINEVQERLDLIYRLQNKHRVASVEDLIAIQDDLQQQLDAFGDLSNEIEALEVLINEQEQHLTELAMDLRKRRKAVIPNFEKKVQKMLMSLGMRSAKLRVEISNLEDLHPTGQDEVNFLFAANKGSRLQLIKDVASGGEVSRLTLVTKSLVASAIPLPTLIFDEIDTGISGNVALKMGDILRQLSNQHQVVSITHSPQIAAKADSHYFVYKKEKTDRTVTHLRLLNMEERIKSIAIMLSSNPPSHSAIENARELIETQKPSSKAWQVDKLSSRTKLFDG